MATVCFPPAAAPNPPGPAPDILAPQEFEVAECLARGLRNVEISRVLAIGETHVGHLVWKIKQRWGIDSRARIAEKFNAEFPDADARRAGYLKSCETLVWRLKNRVSWMDRKAKGPRPRTLEIAVRDPETRPNETLLPREFRVLALTTTGLTNREIGARLKLTENSVKGYMKGICSKIGIENRVAAAVWFVQRYPTDEAVRRGYAQCMLQALETKRWQGDTWRRVR